MTENQVPAPPTYLGDGVYINAARGDLCMWTERENGTHYIYLDEEVATALIRYLRSAFPQIKE